MQEWVTGGPFSLSTTVPTWPVPVPVPVVEKKANSNPAIRARFAATSPITNSARQRLVRTGPCSRGAERREVVWLIPLRMAPISGSGPAA